MNYLTLSQQLAHIKWLKIMNVEYYCSLKKNAKKNPIKLALQQIEPLIQVQQQKNILDLKAEEAPVNQKYSNMPKNKIDKDDSKEIQEARIIADKIESLEELKQELLNFNGCILKEFAINTVIADGNPESDVMLIGEAPGANEDKMGIPFCGESGKLLDNMLAAIGLYRNKNVYITNAIFWRPPGNRRPTNEEVEMCKPFVEKHIALINPKIIILVGSTAATALIGKNDGMSNLRQKFFLYENKYLQKPITSSVIFHPAYLMRQPSQKKNSLV